MLGAVFGLLVGLVTTHEILLGYRVALWTARVPIERSSRYAVV